MNPVWAVLRKEMTDSLRDRRSLASVLLFPLVGPLLLGIMFTYLGERELQNKEVDLPVLGREHAPGLIHSLEGDGIHIVPGPAEPEAAVRKGDVALVLIIPPDFAARFREGQSAPLELIVDDSRSDAHSAVGRVKKRLHGIAARTATLRLLARGVDPGLAEPLALTEVDVSTPQKLAARLFGIIPMFVLLAAFMGGMYVATDSTAGERERGSLEPLLINPTPRTALVLGKWLATVIFSSVTALFTLGVTIAVLSQIPLGGLGMRFSVTAADVGWLAATALPLCWLASAAQLCLATLARSYKEAQAYLSYMIFVPTFPGVVLSVVPLQSKLWMAAVPVFGQQVLLMDIIRGEPVGIARLLVAAATAAICAAACVAMTARLFGRERIIFGR